MSSTNKTANYELSQFVGTDIPSILNDYNGDMRKIDSAIHNASVAGGDNATAIAELQTTTARMNTEIGGINSTVNTIGGKVVAIEEVIPATASAQNKLLTAQELPEIPSITELESDVAELQSDVAQLQGTIAEVQSDLDNKHAIKILHFSKEDYATFGDMLTAIASEIYKPAYHYGKDIYALEYVGLSGLYFLRECSGGSFVFGNEYTWAQGESTDFVIRTYKREIHMGAQYQLLNSDVSSETGVNYSDNVVTNQTPSMSVNKARTDSPQYDIDILYFDR